MKIELLCRGIVESNCYALVHEGEAVLVDAGAHPDDIESAAEKRGLKIKAILLTHGHFDHILGAQAIYEKYGVPVIINTDAHDPSAVGRFEHALDVITETGFDTSLILNTDEKKLMDFLMR